MGNPLRPLTNAEIIYREQPKNVLLVQIPHSQYHLFCEKHAVDNWTLMMINLDNTDRELVRERMTDKEVGKMINDILSNKYNFNV